MTPEAPSTPPGRPEEARPSWFRRFLGWLMSSARPVSLERRPALRPGQAAAGQTEVDQRETGQAVASSQEATLVIELPTASPSRPAAAQAAHEAPLVLATEPLRALAERLTLEELDPVIARSLLLEVLRDVPRERWGSEVEIYAAAAQVLMRWSSITGPLELRPGTFTVVALIGPTGVGKSTTLAKLAAISAHKDHNSVGLISTDTYRIAAAEQIRVYARILGLPLAVVRTREEMQAALQEFAQRDLVFVDTAGQSPNEQLRLQELEELLGSDVQIRRLLVISATTKQSDVNNILRRFEPLRYDGIIVTKLDESRSHGVLINAPYSSGRPLVYLGVGQQVPADIELATRERVADLLLDLSGHFSKGT